LSRSPTWLDDFGGRLAALEAQQRLRKRRIVVPAGPGHCEVDGERLLAFCSNDYLGLANHPALVEAVRSALPVYGVGAGASPMVSGHSAANSALERELAAFVQLPRALYFYAGYATNASLISALVGPGDALFSDALNHACLIDGARLSRAEIHRYRHASLDQLAAQLEACPARRKLIISDTVFSMDGDIANIPALVELAEAHDALLLLDDAHGFGVLGPEGRGALAAAGLTGERASRRVLYMATLGKAAGVAGAFVAGDEPLVEWLLQSTRSYTFATAAPALLAEALRASLRCIEAGDGLRHHLNGLVARLRSGLKAACVLSPPSATPAAPEAISEAGPAANRPTAAWRQAGWRLLPSNTAIQPLIVGDNRAALGLMEGLRQMGIWVPAIRPPTVPEGSARLRIALSAAHRMEDVDRLVDSLATLAAQR
jgi:8-amino-7-oxononanoate synthase